MTKKILFFFPENPFSSRAGNVTRAKTTLSILKKLGNHIDLVGVSEIYSEQNDTTEVNSDIVDNLFLIRQRPPKKKTSLDYWEHKILQNFTKPNPYNFALTNFAKKEFVEIFNKGKYHIIIINYEFWTGLIDDVSMKNTKKIIDTHDWITLNEFYKNKSLDIGKRFNEEINNLSKFDKIITISEDEHIVFKRFLGKKVINIPPSFPAHFETNLKKKYDLIFVGSENIFNIKSMQWFFENVYPFLPKNINIVIIGRICRRIEKKTNVELIEFVESLEEYYGQSKIAICPMLEGTGIKIKVIEALSYGLPIVGTERSIDGFSSKLSNGCLVADDPEKFRDNIVSLLENKPYYDEIKKDAERYFNNNFDEQNAEKKWKKTLSDE
ncbi:glycosyltransferase [Epilithonimonas hungarica]|uniref:Glycosyltransferase involved in cell wall bisynthesis n=1 Tax=Epilithonimonas hungarica TaxID=454006 RepID=A0A1G7VH18_9FLAO|nr:glycosyltransferase [Epilithonimonas hungarica]MDP9957810.1 glycosyltransferase involved in cell wall biosynthesis [Epilithonimonas hungarica]SDG59126.1 Glycosyltransferase involved in cell wall bisynthesis [Epilithonimonas hungarica]